ncbi:MAG TPA: ATP-binding cassette domain-containing protein [Candidatus Limnocylindria bacterium]|nr:ATP-binding cassette domain-containing protein [Candidatus Limnocylindria bacterium]
MSVPETKSAPETKSGVSVHVRGLRKSFGEHAVLKGIDLEIQAGEIFVIMGPSGSGKSIFLRHVIGLETPDGGEVLVDNIRVEDDSIRDRVRMAMVFQSGGLLNSLSVAENVGLYLAEHRIHPPKEIARVVKEKLEAVQLNDADGEKNPTELSGGMKKRVAIARALVMEPQLVLYDEPTSELDPLVAITIGREIVKLNRRVGATTVVVSHDRDLAFGIADRIAFLADGKILQVGTKEEIKSSQIPLIQEFISADFAVK